MGGYVKDMYRLPMCLPWWFLRNSVIYPRFRLVVPTGVSIAVPALQKRPIWSIIVVPAFYWDRRKLRASEWSLREWMTTISENEMQVERKTPDMEAILEVFRDLGLEDVRLRDKFQRLAEAGDWHTWRKRRLDPQKILRINREAIMPNWNQFFDEIRADKTGIGEVVGGEAIA